MFDVRFLLFYAPNLEFRSSFSPRRLVTVLVSVILYRPFVHNKLRTMITLTSTKDEAVFPHSSFGFAVGTQNSENQRPRHLEGFRAKAVLINYMAVASVFSADRVVPMGQDFFPFEANSFHLVVADLDATRVCSLVQK